MIVSGGFAVPLVLLLAQGAGAIRGVSRDDENGPAAAAIIDHRRLTAMSSVLDGEGGSGALAKEAVPLYDELEHIECSTPDGTCMNDDNHAECLNLLRDGCVNLAFKSCPYKLECLDWGDLLPPSQSLSSKYFETTEERSFKVALPVFDTDITEGYSSISELRDGIVEFAKFHANRIIEGGNSYNILPIAEFVPDVVDAGPVNGPTTAASAGGIDDFETNNQEEGIDEADLVKSDGTYVYSGYGDILVIWEAATGVSVLNMTLSLPSLTDFSFGYQPRPQIQALLLENDRLVLVASGYSQESQTDSALAFYEGKNTRVLVYDTSNLPSGLSLLFQKDIQGNFRDARSIGSVVHLVSTSSLDTWSLLEEPLSPWQANYEGLTDEEYKIAATQVAETESIPVFVDAVLASITADGLPNMPRISLWQSVLSNATEAVFDGGAINAYTQLTSFDISQPSISVSTASAFTPSSWGVTYSAEDMLIFAMEGWNYMPEFSGTGQNTYLVGFSLDGASATPTAVGSIPGYLINEYSLDIQDGYLRAATTIRSMWPVLPFMSDGTPFWQPVATTHNQVIILEIPTDGSGVFEEVSRVENLGKPGEIFTAVRFFTNMAYVVTFQRTDPFYVLDLSDPLNPSVRGELEITGFSSYLHSINADDTILLGVGQEADETGVVLGVQISIYNATVPENPSILTRYTIETDPDVWSSSSVEWDYKAFRYTTLGQDVGILTIPLRVQAFPVQEEGNFDGFVVYNVDVATPEISERLSISHVDSADFYGCYYQAYLPQRSMIFNGNVTTLKGHSVVSTDLDEGNQEWKLDMPAPTEAEYCIYW